MVAVAAMEINKQDIAFLMAQEGFARKAYADGGGGRYSIGYGTRAKDEHETITFEEAERRLTDALEHFAQDLEQKLEFAPTASQQTALLSLVYNLGLAGTQGIIDICNSGQFDKAAEHAKEYVFSDGNKLAALVRRRDKEARLLQLSTSRPVVVDNEMTRGEPRVQYKRVYHVLAQNAGLQQFLDVAQQAYSKKETVGFSYDDAGIGNLEHRKVVLHGTHPDNILDWFQEHYNGVDVVSSTISPKTPPQPPVTQTKALWGLHSSADGCWGNPILPEIQDMVKTAKIEAVKMLSNESSESAKILKGINSDIFLLVRLFAKVNDEHSSASDFINTVGAQARSFYDQGVRYFEVHNEPNLNVEGFGSSWSDGAKFSTFFNSIIGSLEKDMPEAEWGYPGLSPGHNIDGVRYDPMRFFEESWEARKRADFICAHAYFTSDYNMGSLDGGNWYKRYDTQGKLLMLTEFSNPSKDISKAIKGAQYNSYVQKLKGVHSAFCFVATASGGFDHETWSGSPIATIVGSRNGNATR